MGNTFEEVKARSKELARKRELSENEEFIARAACMNKVFSVLNEVIPKLQESLSEGYKLKADGSLYAKDEERLKVILDEIKEKYKVEGYPTIKLVVGNQVIEYDAKPDVDTLKQFLNVSL